MSNYFKPLRRKLGVVTLLMACVFSAAWVRSLTTRDFIFIEFEFPFGGRINTYTMSNQMKILLQRNSGWLFDFGQTDSIVRLKPLKNVWFFEVQPIEEEIVDEVVQVSPGYEVGVYFHAIVIPLTLLSAWLLLSKPRTRTLKPALEPRP